MPIHRLAFLLGAIALPVVPVAADTPPKLGVIIVVDQLRADYLTRFAPWFGDGGFRRFEREGTVFTDAHYRYAVTKTAAGHATIATGVNPLVHGIVANAWLDRASWLKVDAVEDTESPLVGAEPLPPSPGGVLAARAGRSPRSLRAPTVGDQLKLRQRDQSRVIGISHKDRAAILLGGKLADAAYWQYRGRFVTSEYYRRELPAWVRAFNEERRVEADFGKTWDRLLPAEIYDRVQGPDDAPGEANQHALGRTFPHLINGGHHEVTGAYYDAHSLTPNNLYLVADFAIAALKAEKLGRGPATDLLCVSFSQLDATGHAYGPDSHEVMDSMIHLDRALARLLEAIDTEVGLDHCVIVLSADHGASPLPERVAAQGHGLPAGRFFGPAVDQQVEAALTAKFGALPEGQYWVYRENAGYHLRETALRQAGVSLDDAAEVVKATLLPLPSMHTVYTRRELLAASAEGDSLLARSRRSFYPARGHDVVFVFNPYFIDYGTEGANHGTPWTYDTHVPLLWLGQGVAAARRADDVSTDEIASTLCVRLGLPSPPESKGRPLDLGPR